MVDDAVSKALKKLDGMPILDTASGGIVDVSAGPGTNTVTVGERLRRLYVSINTVRAAASIYLDSEGHAKSGALKDIRFKLRLKNIKKSCKSLALTFSGEFTG